MTRQDKHTRDSASERESCEDDRYDRTGTPGEEAVVSTELVPHEHPSARALLGRCPWMRYIPLFGYTVESFGPKFTVSLGLSYFMSKGLASTCIFSTRQPMLMRHFGLDATRYQRLASLYTMGWATKAFIAAVTDTFPFFGYTKRWYMVVCAVIGASCALAYGLLPAKPSSANIAAAFLFLTSLSKASVDILSQGHYSRAMRRHPAAGPTLISWVWWMINCGYAAGACVVGPMSDAGVTTGCLFIAAGLEYIMGIFYGFNWYGERRNREERCADAKASYMEQLTQLNPSEAAVDRNDDTDAPVERNDGKRGHGVVAGLAEPEEIVAEAPMGGMPPTLSAVIRDGEDEIETGRQPFVEPHISSCLCGVFEINRGVLRHQWRIVAFSAVMAASVIVLAVVTILGTKWHLLYASVVIAVVCMASAFFALPLTIAKAAVFLYLHAVVYLSLPGALNSFYLASEECVPNGPHFSYTFYNTVAEILSSVAGMAGAACFSYIFSKQTYQVTFIVTTLLKVVASLFDLVLVKRWNIYVGIPDHAMYVCGYAIIYEVVSQMSSMPIQLLMSRLCPRGSEAMVFALMAGMANTGGSMSNAIGSLLMETVWPVDSRSRPCDFHNVPYLIITGHLCLPMLTVPLAFVLLPRARICDLFQAKPRSVTKTTPAQGAHGGEEGDHPAPTRKPATTASVAAMSQHSVVAEHSATAHPHDTAHPGSPAVAHDEPAGTEALFVPHSGGDAFSAADSERRT